MVIWLDIVFHTDQHLIMKILWLLVALGYGFSIMYSRLFLGVHSIDQVVYGASIGIWSAFTMQFCLRDYIEQEIKNLNECLVTNFKTRFLICWLAFIIVEGGQVIEFVTLNHLITKNDDNQPIWSINIKMAGCERSLLEPFQTLSLV